MPALRRSRDESFICRRSRRQTSRRKRHFRRTGGNFTNILRKAFTCTDPKSTKIKNIVKLSVFFAFLGSSRVKALCKTLINWHQIAASLASNGSHYYHTCWRHAAGFVLSPPLREDLSTADYLMQMLANGELHCKCLNRVETLKSQIWTSLTWLSLLMV